MRAEGGRDSGVVMIAAAAGGGGTRWKKWMTIGFFVSFSSFYGAPGYEGDERKKASQPDRKAKRKEKKKEII